MFSQKCVLQLQTSRMRHYIVWKKGAEIMKKHDASCIITMKLEAEHPSKTLVPTSNVPHNSSEQWMCQQIQAPCAMKLL